MKIIPYSSYITANHVRKFTRINIIYNSISVRIIEMQHKEKLNCIRLKHRSVTITILLVMVYFFVHVLLDQCLMWTTCTCGTGISIRFTVLIKCINNSSVFTCLTSCIIIINSILCGFNYFCVILLKS